MEPDLSRLSPQPLPWEAYKEERKAVAEREREILQNFEKYLLTLSGGALGLTITFVQQIAPHPREVGWLYVAWAGFGLTILLMLLSYLISARALRNYWAMIDSDQEEGRVTRAPKDRWADWTHRSNWIALLTFACAVACLAIFVAENLPS